MLSPLIPDIKHPKWIIAIKILETIASPRAKRIASRLKIYDTDNFLLSIKLLVLSDLFERDVSGLIYEIDSNLQLKSLLKVNSKIKQQSIYKLYSELDYTIIYSFFKRLFSTRHASRTRNQEIIIIDTTSIIIDLNLWRNRQRIGKKNKKYKYSFDHTRGYYVGFKLILAINQDFQILGLEIHENSPHDSKLLESFLEKLIRSRIIRSRDIILCDKGFASKKNYHVLINRFYLVPLIYPRKNTNIDRILNNINPPLELFFDKNYKMELWLKVVSDFKKLIRNWVSFKLIRSKIEDFFNVSKNSLGMTEMHQYTKSSIEKKVARVVFLSQELICLFDKQNIGAKAIPHL